jgi:hypothetical protein
VRTGSEGTAGIDHDRDSLIRRLLPGWPNPEAADPDTVVERAPAVLPALGDVVDRQDVEADGRLLRVDSVGAVELLDTLREDMEQERELRLAADDDVAIERQRKALFSLSNSPSDLP